MTAFRRRVPSLLCYVLVSLTAFIFLQRAGHGFPGSNPNPGQLVVSPDAGSGGPPPVMVYIPGGTFRMGDPTGDSYSALPRREVVLLDFYISRYEITFSLYDRYCRAEGLPLPPDGGYGRKDRPVGNVSWFDAVRYCNWLSRTEGLEPCYRIHAGFECDYSRNGYRLPTEAEWEYAASGGQAGRNFMYAGGDDAGEVAWYFDNAGRYPKPVGMKKPNELGLFDMSGNIYEWTNSLLTRDYSDTADGSVNPVGGKGGTTRTVRGGSCFFDSWGCRVWYRKGMNPESRVPYTGFRVVRRASL